MSITGPDLDELAFACLESFDQFQREEGGESPSEAEQRSGALAMDMQVVSSNEGATDFEAEEAEAKRSGTACRSWIAGLHGLITLVVDEWTTIVSWHIENLMCPG